MAERAEYGRRERMAAAAWVKCEGVQRRETLAQLEVPEELVRHQTDIRAIAAEIKPGPSDFLEDAYVYDNGVESWLILISDDNTRMLSQLGSRTHDVPQRGCEKMGLAPRGNGENLGKSEDAKVPVPIFSQPRSGRVEQSGADEAFPWSLWFPTEN